MTQAEWIMQLVRLGYFSFFGLGIDKQAVLDALDTPDKVLRSDVIHEGVLSHVRDL